MKCIESHCSKPATSPKPSKGEPDGRCTQCRYEAKQRAKRTKPALGKCARPACAKEATHPRGGKPDGYCTECRHRANSGATWRRSTLDLFWDKFVEVEGGCWEWVARKDDGGYGSFTSDGKVWRAHCWAYDAFKGEIPEGHEVHHTCNVRACVNPMHLLALTPEAHREITQARIAASRPPAPKRRTYAERITLNSRIARSTTGKAKGAPDWDAFGKVG